MTWYGQGMLSEVFGVWKLLQIFCTYIYASISLMKVARRRREIDALCFALIYQTAHKHFKCNYLCFKMGLLGNFHCTELLICFIRGFFPFSFLPLIFNKSCQDAQERLYGLPCWSRVCQRINYKTKLLFFPFHTRAIHCMEREADPFPEHHGVQWNIGIRIRV